MVLLDKLIRVFLAFVLAIMALVVGANVFCRFVLDFSLYWADELAQILLVWLTFIGAALAVKEKSHYALNYLSEKLKGNTQRAFRVLQQVLTLLSITVLLYFSAIVAWQIRAWEMPATEVSRSFVYSACAIGCVLMLFYAIANALHDFKGRNDTIKDIQY